MQTRSFLDPEQLGPTASGGAVDAHARPHPAPSLRITTLKTPPKNSEAASKHCCDHRYISHHRDSFEQFSKVIVGPPSGIAQAAHGQEV